MKQSGITPVNKFESNDSDDSIVDSQISEEILPLKLLASNFMFSIVFIDQIHCGNEPDSLFFAMGSICSDEILQISLGIVEEMLLNTAIKACNRCKLLILEGILPTRLELGKYIIDIFDCILFVEAAAEEEEDALKEQDIPCHFSQQGL